MTYHADSHKPRALLTAVGLCVALFSVVVYRAVGPFSWLDAHKASALGGYFAVDELGQTNHLAGPDEGDQFFGIPAGTENDGNYTNAHHLQNPGGMEILANSDDGGSAILYVADTDNNRVLGYYLDYSCGDGCNLSGFSSQYPDYVIGQPDFRAGDLDVSDALLNEPTDVAAAAGYLWVADTGNNRVLGFEIGESTPQVGSQTATYVLGQPDFVSNAPGLASTSLDGPQYLSYDSDEALLYVSDTNNNRVLAFDLSVISNGMPATYVLGQPDFSSNAPSLSQTGMDHPTGITWIHNSFDPGIFLFVSDTNNNRVLVFDARAEGSGSLSICADPTTGISNGVIASCVLGQTDFGTNTPGGSSDSTMSRPAALATGYHILYVGSETDNRVLVFSVDSISMGQSAADELGAGDFNTADPCDTSDEPPCASSVGVVRGVENIDLDGDGGIRVFISDSSSNRILQFSTPVNSPGYVDAVAVRGQSDHGSELFNSDSNISEWGFSAPAQLARDVSLPGIYVADEGNNRVLGHALDGVSLPTDRQADIVIGQGNSVSGHYGLEWFVQESAHDYEGPFRSGISNWADEDCFTGPCHTVGNAYDYNLSEPSGVVFDSSGRLYVLDAGNARLQRFDTQNNGDSAAASVALTDGPGDRQIAYDAGNNRLFVPHGESGDAVTIYDTDFNVLEHMFGIPSTPTAVAYDGTNSRLYVSAGNCVYIFDGSVPLEGQSAIGMLGDNDPDCTGGGTDANSMQGPQGLSVDVTGNRLFVADSFNNRILQFDATSVGFDNPDAVEVYGQTDLTSAVSGLGADALEFPTSVLYLEDGNRIAVSDTNNNRILFFDAADNPTEEGEPTTEHLATDEVGQVDAADTAHFTSPGSDNAPSARGVSSPFGVAMDTVHHRLFVTDTDNARVLVYQLDETDHLSDPIADWVLGSPDFKTYSTGLTDATTLGTPSGVTYDAVNDRLFVADPGFSRLLVYDVATITNGEAAINVIGQEDFVSTGTSTAQDHIGTSYPMGVSFDADNERLFVGDSDNRRVMVFDVDPSVLQPNTPATDGPLAIGVIGQDDFTTVDAGISDRLFGGDVSGLAYDSADELLFVADDDANRVLAFPVSPANLASEGNGATDGISLNAEAVLGQNDFVDDECNDLCVPAGVSYDADGQRLFVSTITDNIVAVFDLSDGVTTEEPYIHTLGTFTGETTQAGFQSPLDLAVANDVLFVADTSNQRVMVFDVDAIDDGEDAVDVIGQLDGDDTPRFDIGNANNAPNAQGINTPYYSAIDATHHRLFVADQGNSRVLVFNLTPDNTLIDHTADFVLGQTDFKGNGGDIGVAVLNQPTGVAYDAVHDLLFVTDRSNNRVMVFDVASITDGEPAVHVLGQNDFDSSDPNQGGLAGAATLSGPVDVSIEPASGLLAVSDTQNNRVLLFDLGPGMENLADGMDADHVVGQPDLGSTGSDVSAVGMSGPNGILAEATTNSLWVADYGNNRVLRYNLFDSSDGQAAVSVLGQTDFDSSSYSSVTASSMGNPSDVTLSETDDESQRLFVVDLNGSRVMVFDITEGITDGQDAVDIYGQPTFTSNDVGTANNRFQGPYGVDYDETSSTLYVTDSGNNRVLMFGPDSPTPTPNGHSSGPPAHIGFSPRDIVVNLDDTETDSRNVLVKINATNTNSFTGTVDVLLSNDPRFSTFIPFRYAIPEKQGNTETRDIWPKTVAWDLCFGLPSTIPCDPGRKVVYARFYVNVAHPEPVLVPEGETNTTP